MPQGVLDLGGTGTESALFCKHVFASKFICTNALLNICENLTVLYDWKYSLYNDFLHSTAFLSNHPRVRRIRSIRYFCRPPRCRFLVAFSLNERFGFFIPLGALVVVVAIVALIALDPFTVLITTVPPSLVL